MSKRIQVRKLGMIKHRELMICNAISDVLEGKKDTDYAIERARKLKEIRK